MLHGQSAGAIDSYTISTLPQAPQLISAGIYESGAGRDLAYQDTVEKLSASYAQYLNCTTSVVSSGASSGTVEC
jgi:carboxylesterase type B